MVEIRTHPQSDVLLQYSGVVPEVYMATRAEVGLQVVFAVCILS
jgi:hypothetical protein